MLLLLAVGAATGGGYAFYYWNRSDEILRQTMLDRLHEMAPDWNVSISRARFDYEGRIHVYDLSLKGSDGRSPLIDVGEAVLTVDPEMLAEPHPAMRHVKWVRPKVHLERDADGVWNWQKLPPPKLPKNVIPEIDVEQMTLSLVFHDSGSGPGAITAFDDVHLNLIPSGARQYLVKGAAKSSHADEITVEGTWQIDAGAWDLKGQLENLLINGQLSKLAADFSPDYRRGLSRLDALIDKLSKLSAGSTAAIAPAPVAPAPAPAAEMPVSLAQSSTLDAVARLGLTASADVQFRITQWRPGAEREFTVAVRILQGELTTPPIPFPLRDLRGQIELKNQQILLREFSAASGPTQLTLERGSVLENGELRPAKFDLEITSLPLDARLRGLLPPAMRRVFDDVQPTGEIDLGARLEFDGNDHWGHDCDVVVRNCTARHVKFPYQVEQIQGTLTRRGQVVDVALDGRAGLQRIVLSGRIENPGPEAHSLFVIKSAGIPIDEPLRDACPRHLQSVIDQLQATGELTGQVTLERPAGLNQPLAIVVDARLRNGTVNCRPFPFPLTAVSGHFFGSGGRWRFEKFTGRHGTAEVTLAGAFYPDNQGRSQLEMDFSLVGAAFDRQLFMALPEDLQSAWNEFTPKGGLNVSGKAFWSPGAGRLHLADMQAELFDGSLSLKSFPFDMSDVAAKVTYDGELFHIKSFSGRHDETVFKVKAGSGYYKSDGQWRVTLDKMLVDDLEATLEFRKSLPPQLLKIVNSLNPRGKQSISGFLEFRGKRGGNYPVTAAWDTETVYSGTTLSAGVDLHDMHGKAYFRGTWDGNQAVGDGRIDLRSVKIFDYQLTDIKGPASINGSRLVLGAPPAAGRPEPDRTDHTGRLSARFIKGLLALDADIRLGEPSYEVWMTLKDGQLRQFAQLYMPNNNKLAGVMNGSIRLKGSGIDPKRLTGSGQLVVKPAALYELPVIVQIFDVLRLVPPDKKAFDEARFVFDIKGGLVHFGRIDLVGNSLNLVGHGTVGFDGSVRLGFLSQTGRLQWPIPIVRETINELTKGWIGVDVQGTLKDPKTRVRSLPQMDDALRRLMEPRSAMRK